MPVEEVKVEEGKVDRPRTGSTSGETGVTLARGESLANFVGEAQAAHDRESAKAKYKLEVIFSRHRSPNRGKPSPSMLIIWESGKKFHGGGDSRMYWCGYDDCKKPISGDLFAYMHVVCPSCRREIFLDEDSRKLHVRDMLRRGLDPKELQRVPLVVGERLMNLTPRKLAMALEIQWRILGGDADIYVKFSPHDIRYDPKGLKDGEIAGILGRARSSRQPLIYSLKNIIKDVNAGANLQKRFEALLTS
jgi:hypothetical protein